MNKNLHDIDDLFHSSLESNEEHPSASVWEKINASLDKEDALSYKRRFIAWKRLAIILLLLLSGFILYETGIINFGLGHLNDQDTNNNKRLSRISGQKKATRNSNEIHRDTNQDLFRVGNVKEINKNKNDKDEKINNIAGFKNTNYRGGLNSVRPSFVTKLQFNKIDAVERNEIKKVINNLADQDQLKLNNQTIFNDKENVFLFWAEKEVKQLNIPAPLIGKNIDNDIKIQLRTGIQHVELPLVNEPILNSTFSKELKQVIIKPLKPYWLITGYASYDRVNYKLDSDLPVTISNIRHQEAHEPSFSGGILIKRQHTKHWGLQTGIGYSHTSIGISSQKLFAFQDPSGDIGYKFISSSGYAYIKPGNGPPPAFGDTLNTIEAKHNIKSVSVPVSVKYQVRKNKIMFIPGVGVEANYITSAKVEVEIENASNRETVIIKKLSGIKSFYWTFVADAEVQYKLNKNLSLSIRPTFRHALTPITKENVVETIPFSFGIGLGLSYQF